MRMKTPRGDVFEIMTPVMEPLEQMLRTQEASCEEQGWDQRPTYFVLSKSPAGLMMASVHWMPNEMYENPAEYVGEFAEFVGWPLAKLALGRLLPKTYYGIVCFHEAWMRSGINLKELESGPRPSQAPDRQEIRTGIAVTVDGRIATIIRTRNEPPPMFQELGDGVATNVGGRLIDGLRLLCDNLEKIARA